MTTKHELGQYFTTHPELKQKVLEFMLNRFSTILEPSIGRGDLVAHIMDHYPNTSFDMYEIDTTITLLEKIQKDQVIYGDFMEQTITKKYNTIVGNPPYVRTKQGNLYIDFTEKCYNLLNDGGELIFIVPADFMKLTSASKLLDTMMTHGTFTHIYHPHNERMFENASIDVMVFRYCKNPALEKRVLYNDTNLYITNSCGFITFGKCQKTNNTLFQEWFDIYVGMVTGKEDVFKRDDIGNLDVLNGENKFDKYIYIENFPCENESINQHLLQHKEVLINRGIRKFDDSNWFEWGAPRNIKTIQTNLGKDCIYLYNLTRKKEVAFVGKVNYFGGGLIMLIPKTPRNLQHVVSYFNSDTFKSNFMFSGRFKIGHRQISYSHIPDDLSVK